MKFFLAGHFLILFINFAVRNKWILWGYVFGLHYKEITFEKFYPKFNQLLQSFFSEWSNYMFLKTNMEAANGPISISWNQPWRMELLGADVVPHWFFTGSMKPLFNRGRKRLASWGMWGWEWGERFWTLNLTFYIHCRACLAGLFPGFPWNGRKKETPTH